MGLNAEFNLPVAGLQLRLEVFCPFFLNLELKKYTEVLPNYQSESELQSPSSKVWVSKYSKTKNLMNDSTDTVWMF